MQHFCIAGLLKIVVGSISSPRARHAPRARLAFASFPLKYAKKYGCSAGYGVPKEAMKDLNPQILEIREGSSNSQSCDSDYIHVDNLRKLENSRSFGEPTRSLKNQGPRRFSKAPETFRACKAIFLLIGIQRQTGVYARNFLYEEKLC